MLIAPGGLVWGIVTMALAGAALISRYTMDKAAHDAIRRALDTRESQQDAVAEGLRSAP